VADADSSDILGTIDPESPNVIQAQEFLEAGIAELGPDDPSAAVLESFLLSFQLGGAP
jgi:hypothetical protein